MDVSELRPRQIQQGRERLRHRYDGQHLPAVALDPCPDVEHVVFEVREGVEVIHYLRRNDGGHAGIEIAPAVFPLLRREGGRVQAANALGAQTLPEQAADVLSLPVERPYSVVDCRQLLAGRHAGTRVACLGVEVCKVEEAAHADHKELVQVAGEDGGEFEALKERHTLVERLREHPVVEGEPGELAVLSVALFRH